GVARNPEQPQHGRCDQVSVHPPSLRSKLGEDCTRNTLSEQGKSRVFEPPRGPVRLPAGPCPARPRCPPLLRPCPPPCPGWPRPWRSAQDCGPRPASSTTTTSSTASSTGRAPREGGGPGRST